MAKTVLSMVKTRLKSKSKPRKRNNMARKKGGKRRSSGGRGFGGIGKTIRNPTIIGTATALGLGTLGVLVASKAAPQFAGIASIGAPLLAGVPLTSIAIAEAVKAFAGAPSILSGFGGGMGSVPMNMVA